MDLPVNKFKHALKTDRIQYGLWLGLPDTTCAEICAGAGFDWVLVDAEHSLFDPRSVLTHLQAMAPYDVSPIVRPVEGDKALIKQYLDVGAQTLLIPMVETAEQAAELVKAVRYPPAGERGLGTSLARAARWNTIPGYLKKADEEICLIVQVETASAMENLEEIVKVEGLDGVFIGPSDLSASMGYIGDAGNPAVVSAIENGLRIIRAAGKAAGLLCMDPELAKHYATKGANFVGLGVDTLLLSQSARRLAASFKSGEPLKEEKPQAGY